MFHSFVFFQFSSKVQVPILLFTFLQFYSVVSRNSKVHNFASCLFFSFFYFIMIRSGLLAEIRWSVCMSKSNRSLCVSFSRTGAGLCIYHLNDHYYYYCQFLTPVLTSARFGLVWFGLVLRHINHCWLRNAKFYFYIYVKYMICKLIL